MSSEPRLTNREICKRRAEEIKNRPKIAVFVPLSAEERAACDARAAKAHELSKAAARIDASQLTLHTKRDRKGNKKYDK